MDKIDTFMSSGVRGQLLETDDHICPTCGTPDVSPDSLIANQSLRKAATTFQNESSKQHMPPFSSATSVTVSLKSSQPSHYTTPSVPVRPAVVPRGPSVLDYRPPPKPTTPPVVAPASRPPQPVPLMPEPAPLPIQTTVSAAPTQPQVSPTETYDRLVYYIVSSNHLDHKEKKYSIFQTTNNPLRVGIR